MDQLTFTDAELKAIRSEFAKGATDEQFENFIRECKTRNLIPGRHVVFQLRRAKEYDSTTNTSSYVNKATHITTIDAFRLIAQRTRQYSGQDPVSYIYLDSTGLPEIRSSVPLPQEGSTQIPKVPWAVEVSVHRKDFDVPLKAIARFDAYAQYYKKDNKWYMTDMWERRGPEQCAKCAEALALRQAFPEELGGLYISEEFKDDNLAEPVLTPAPQQEATTAVSAPAPVTAPPADHTPVEGKDEPRPGEKKRKGRKKNEVEPPLQPSDEELARRRASTTQANPEITDEDLPENLRPGYVPPTQSVQTSAASGSDEEDDPFADATPEHDAHLDEEPDKNEKKAHSEKLRGYGLNSDALRTFILKETKATEVKKLTRRQWANVFGKLDEAKKLGGNALISLVSGS